MTLFVPRAGSLNGMEGKSGEQLSDFLRGHLLGRAVTEDELRLSESLRTLAGTDLRISRDGTSSRVGNARIVRPDVACTNGVIHVVDGPIG